MAVRYKQRCCRCKKNYEVVTWKQKYVVCYECQKKELATEIKDPEMKKLFDIPEEFYKKNSFLRSIKLNYIRYGNLTEKQLEAFKKTVKNLKGKKPDS